MAHILTESRVLIMIDRHRFMPIGALLAVALLALAVAMLVEVLG